MIVVFDIDGTLANIEHRRQFVASKPKNWAAFNAGMKFDKVHEDISRLLFILYCSGSMVVLCSGRGEENRKVTEEWLFKNEIPYDKLYMRSAGDYRKDSIVKVELLARIREEWGEPSLWFDDRNQVVDAIRAEGVRVLQVCDGNF